MSWVPLDQVLIPLTTALGLAIVVERVIELLKNVANVIPTSTDVTVVATEVKKAADEVEKLAKFTDAATHDEDAPDQHPLETILVQDATDSDDGTTLRTFGIQATAIITGILAAHYSGLHLFSAFGATVPPWLDFVLTGLFIGGGSGPAHVLIRFITERKFAEPAEELERAEAPVKIQGETVAAAENGDRALPAAAGGKTPALLASRVFASAPAPSIDGTLDIPYAGGVDREKLQSVHIRPANPHLIVYHHTAMPLKSTFEDLVNVIKKDRGWITGYHCVITADGVIHPFCRWDRYGNHAQNYNARSLGVSLNGNFETNPKEPYSNPDGRYGPSRPPEAQLDAAARVTALWLCMYPDIPLDFDGTDKGVVPHKRIVTTPKTCPGNMFPYAQYQQLVRHYREIWAASPTARDTIEAFKKRQYLYVDGKIPKTQWPAVEEFERIPVHTPAYTPAVAAPVTVGV